jgi:hypothetical protein
MYICESEGCPHFEARASVGRGLPHSKDSLSLLMGQYSKETCVKKKVECAYDYFCLCPDIETVAKP